MHVRVHGVRRARGREDVEPVAASVEEALDAHERADLTQGPAADDPGDEVLRQLGQDGPHLHCSVFEPQARLQVL